MCRQLLNIAHALKRTARGSGSEAVDWVIHLDHDELFLPPPQGLQAHLRHLDTSDCRLCLYQNFEAVPQDHTLTPFVDVTTFKVPSGRVSKTPAGMAGMNFWAQRTKAHNYFLYYDNGKSAVRVSRKPGSEIAPTSVHLLYPPDDLEELIAGKHAWTNFAAHELADMNLTWLVACHDEVVAGAKVLHYPATHFERLWRKYHHLGNFPSIRFGGDLVVPPSFHLEEATSVRFDSMSRRRAIWWFLENSPWAPAWLQWMSLLYQLLTSALIVALFAVDCRTMSEETTEVYRNMEICATIIFTMEYGLRFYSCIESVQDAQQLSVSARWRRRICLMTSAACLIDVVSLISLYLDVCMTSNIFRGVVSIRLLRLFTLFRLERKHKFLSPIVTVISNKRRELGATLGVAGLVLLISATLMYYVESGVNDKFSSILESMWWGTATLTTVGYGDIVPITPLGRCLGSLVAFIGVGLFGLPAGIIASGFADAHRAKSFELRHNSADHLEARMTRMMSVQNEVLAELQSLRTQMDSMLADQQRVLALLGAEKAQQMGG
ncbi:KCNQ5 [Symbiodinium microadriaticum]|nr:KCNQ5 [Symbiodinium microadriaticum]CAE7948952.1 KCNQ5 [Symbiodinium sp. KB8]